MAWNDKPTESQYITLARESADCIYDDQLEAQKAGDMAKDKAIKELYETQTIKDAVRKIRTRKEANEAIKNVRLRCKVPDVVKNAIDGFLSQFNVSVDYERMEREATERMKRWRPSEEDRNGNRNLSTPAQ